MGLQQFILLILVVAVVGAGIYVGVQTYTTKAVRENHEALMQDAIRIASDVQSWKQKPATFGGQASCAEVDVVNDDNNFSCVTFPRLGYVPTAAGPNEYSTLNGLFRIQVISPDSTAVVAINVRQKNKIAIGITGLTDDDLTGATLCMGGVDDAEDACPTVRFP